MPCLGILDAKPFYFLRQVSLCSIGWPRTHCVEQACCAPLCTAGVLGLEAYTITVSSELFFSVSVLAGSSPLSWSVYF